MQEVAENVLKKAHGTELFVLSWQHKLFPIGFSGRFISSDKHKTVQLRVQSQRKHSRVFEMQFDLPDYGIKIYLNSEILRFFAEHRFSSYT